MMRFCDAWNHTDFEDGERDFERGTVDRDRYNDVWTNCGIDYREGCDQAKREREEREEDERNDRDER